jgi:FAD:protein FMN transferase
LTVTRLFIGVIMKRYLSFYKGSNNFKKDLLLSKTTLFLLVILFLLSCSTQHGGNYYKIAGFAQGTSWNITYESPDSVSLKSEVDSILKAFDLSMSVYEPNSVISKVNRNEDVKLDDYFKEVFILSFEVWKKSGGYFDITVMPLVDAWGFGPGAKLSVDSSVIDSLIQYVGMEKVSIENNRILKTNPLVRLDMNAVAQGFSVDVVCRYFDVIGLKNYMVEIGGEIRVKGVNPSGQPWKIGVDKPSFDNMMPGQQLQVILQLKNHALATSGNYRKFYEEDGVKYSHSINPKTGYPVKHRLLSTTIIADDCMTADAWATAFMVMGLEKSIEFLEMQNDLQAYLIYGDEVGQYQIYTTKGLKPFLVKELNSR